MRAGKIDLTSVITKLDKITDDIKREIAAGLFVSGQKIEETARLSIMGGGKTGRAYKRGAKTHIASAPGEAPANDTGRLQASINTSQTSRGMIVYIKAGEGIVDYARHLEFGTDNMAERPFMKPALDKSLGFIRQRMEKAIKRGMAKNGVK